MVRRPGEVEELLVGRHAPVTIFLGREREAGRLPIQVFRAAALQQADQAPQLVLQLAPGRTDGRGWQDGDPPRRKRTDTGMGHAGGLSWEGGGKERDQGHA